MISPDSAENTHSVGDNMNEFMTNDKVDVTLAVNDQCDENISFPSSSSSSTTTPIPTTPTREIPKQAGSPIMRGLQNVLNMFRSSQGPVERGREVSTPDITPRVSNGSLALDSPVVASTPVASRKGDTSKRNSPLKDSIVFTEELSNDLQWHNDSTVIFHNEKVPLHKLFMQQPLSNSSSDFSSDNSKSHNLQTSVEPMDISLNESDNNDKTITVVNRFNSRGDEDRNDFIEPMDISYNESVVNRTGIVCDAESFSETKLLNESINNSVFLDCESSLYGGIQNETELLKSFDEYTQFSGSKINNPTSAIKDPMSADNENTLLKVYVDNNERGGDDKNVETEEMDSSPDKTICENKALEDTNSSTSLNLTAKENFECFNVTKEIFALKSDNMVKKDDTLEAQILNTEINESQENILEITDINAMPNLDNTINIINAIIVATDEGFAETEQMKGDGDSLTTNENIHFIENVEQTHNSKVNDDNPNSNVAEDNNVIVKTDTTTVASDESLLKEQAITPNTTENIDASVIISNENVIDKSLNDTSINVLPTDSEMEMNIVSNELETPTIENEKIHDNIVNTIIINNMTPSTSHPISNDIETKNDSKLEAIQVYLDKSIELSTQLINDYNIQDKVNSTLTDINDDKMVPTRDYEVSLNATLTQTIAEDNKEIKTTEDYVPNKDAITIKNIDTETEIRELKLELLQNYLEKSQVLNDNENDIKKANSTLDDVNNSQMVSDNKSEINIIKSKLATLQPYIGKPVEFSTHVISDNENNTIKEANSTFNATYGKQATSVEEPEDNFNVTLTEAVVESTNISGNTSTGFNHEEIVETDARGNEVNLNERKAKENKETICSKNNLLDNEIMISDDLGTKTQMTESKLQAYLDKSVELSSQIINDNYNETNSSFIAAKEIEGETSLNGEGDKAIKKLVEESVLINKKNIKPNANPVYTNIDFENLENPFVTKSKIRMSPPNTPSAQYASIANFDQIENPFATKSKVRLSPPPFGDGLAVVSKDINTEFIEDVIDSDKENKPLNISLKGKQESGIKRNSTINQQIITNSTVVNKLKDVNDIILKIDNNIESQDKVKEASSSEQSVYVSVSEEDAIHEDVSRLDVLNTEVNPFVKNVCDEFESNSDDKNDFEFDINNDTIPVDSESNEPEEVFIDAAAFDFLMNKNGNAVEDNGKESLFLKFDPLCARRITTEGFVAALKENALDRVTESEQRNINVTQVDAAFEQNFEDMNATVAQKPTMAVMPAVNNAANVFQVVPSTPNRSTRHSMTFCSPAVALIDRLLSINTPDRHDMTVAHDETVPHVAAPNDTEDALRQFTQMLAEKEEHNNMLRCEKRELETRLDNLESQIKSLERDNEGKLKKINELTSSLVAKTTANKNMVHVVEEFERTIARLVAEIEQEKKLNAEERLKLISERDEQNTHLASMEVSFKDLHSKFEKCRQVILTYKANEDEYKRKIAEFEESLKKMQKNYEQLKQHATTKLNNANEQLDLMNKSHETEVLRMKAIIKRRELDISSIEETINQKTKAIEDLTAICDELINSREI